MATGEIFQLQGKDAVLKLNHYAAINAVQSFDWDPSFNEEVYQELGNEKDTARSITPEVSGSFEMTATGATVAFLKRMIMKREVTGEFEGFLAGTTPDNAGLIRGRDLEHAVFDIVEAKKANEAFTRSLLIPRAHLSSVSFRADAQGAASETYQFEGEVAEVYRNPMHDLTPAFCTRISATEVELGLAGIDVSPTGTHTLVQLMIDDQVVDVADLTVGAGGTEITVGGGYTVPVGSRVIAHVYGNTPGAFPSIAYPTSARFVKADDIDIYLVKNGTGVGEYNFDTMTAGQLNTTAFTKNERLLRIQSADVSVDLRREALRQIAKNDRNTSVYYRAATYPLACTASTSCYETDLADWAKIQGKSAAEVLNLSAFEGQEWAVVMRYFKGDAVLQTIALTDARVSGRSARVSVGGRAEVTWNWSGSDVLIDGSNA